MVVLIFREKEIHRISHADSKDRRILWTRCGIRFIYDPIGYKFARQVTGVPDAKELCKVC